MEIRAINTEADYDWALAEVERYFLDEPRPGSPDADRFAVLSTLIEAYENKHWPIEPLDPVEMLLHTMEETGRTQSDLADLLGSRSRASEILNRKRAITMDMAHKLHEKWKIPAEVLIRPYNLAAGV
ncbi:MAG: helix-turn-helix domain-containing protein [Chelatococcus sp.]|nr:helix-turn-helix domain-containing protein [Chelatococcus sp.]